MARLGSSKITRVDIAGGANKGLRLPYELRLIPELEWWCVGDAERIRMMLSKVHYLGDGRGRGHGKLDIANEPWRVERCEPWPGFPLVRDGLPTRPVPPDWPGLQDPPLGYRVMTAPYFRHGDAELCAVPGH
jgi:CRISPR type IV-associated protein Csf3